MPLGLAVLGAAGISGLSSLASGIIGSSASSKAAGQQAAAAENAQAIQVDELGNQINRVAPWLTAGAEALGGQQNALSTLTSATPGLSAPFASSPGGQMAALAATPGYQFTLHQGEIAAQNQMAGTQPGGAALKSGINYAEGLASTTFQQQFENYLQQNAQVYNMLQGNVGAYGNLSGSGLSAANALGGVGTTAANAISNLATGAGAAQAAGTIGSANAVTGSLNNSTNALTNAIGLSQISSLFGGGGGFAGTTGGAGPLSVPTV